MRQRCTRLRFVLSAVCAGAEGVARRDALDAVLAQLSAGAPHVHRHARRVAAFSGALARRMRRAAADAEAIESAALLHEIGRLALPSSLAAAAAASPRAASLHVALTADILAGAPALGRAAALATAVHERWQGVGLPDGLRGEAIPLGARIIAVADAYDELTAPLPAGDTAGRDRAHAAIVSRAGADFDPDVVHAWLRAAEELPC